MVKNTRFYIHTLLRMHLQPSWARFLSIFLPRHPEKSSFFDERVFIFVVFVFSFRMLFSSPPGTIWGPFGEHFGHLPRHLGILLGPLAASWVLLMTLHHPSWPLSGPQCASRGPTRPQNVQNDPPMVPQSHPKGTQIDRNLAFFVKKN